MGNAILGPRAPDITPKTEKGIFSYTFSLQEKIQEHFENSLFSMHSGCALRFLEFNLVLEQASNCSNDKWQTELIRLKNLLGRVSQAISQCEYLASFTFRIFLRHDKNQLEGAILGSFFSSLKCISLRSVRIKFHELVPGLDEFFPQFIGFLRFHDNLFALNFGTGSDSRERVENIPHSFISAICAHPSLFDLVLVATGDGSSLYGLFVDSSSGLQHITLIKPRGIDCQALSNIWQVDSAFSTIRLSRLSPRQQPPSNAEVERTHYTANRQGSWMIHVQETGDNIIEQYPYCDDAVVVPVGNPLSPQR